MFIIYIVFCITLANSSFGIDLKNENRLLCSELLEMVAKEQDLRMQWLKASNKESRDRAWQRVVEIDEAHLPRLKEITDAYGWPGDSLIGHEGSHAFWLLVQHTPDHSFQQHCLELLEQAVMIGDASTIDLAYLKDRVSILAGRKQIFGTQVDNNLIPFPIEEEERVNERRHAFGLESLEEYLESIKELYNLRNI